MNDKEQMEALLDGKVLMCDGERYKLDGDGDLVQCVGEGWVSDNFIPSINIKYVSVKEDE